MPSDTDPILNTCPECQQVIDVTDVPPYDKILCPYCEETIRVRTEFGQFVIKAEIGVGGMSRVFRATDTRLDRQVALKILHRQFGDDPDLAAQFEREARLTASINHPNVVQVYSVGWDQGSFFIAMELLETESLDSLIHKDALDEATSLRLIHEVVEGLAAAFQRGLIHRDIKPGNILLGGNGAAKLVDFGLALIQGAEDQVADIWATPYYVPPEKLAGEPDNFRGDIFSLGATLYHALAGAPPHDTDSDSIDELIRIKSQSPNLRIMAPRLKSTTYQLVRKMMANKPLDRHRSYNELMSELSDARLAADPDYRATFRGGGFPLWAKLVTALFVIGSLGALVYLFLPSDKPAAAALPGIMGDGSSEVVVSVQEAALVKKLTTARQAYLAGNTAEAVGLFQTLAESDTAGADLRAWSCFHLGLEALLKSDLSGADDYFAKAAKHAKDFDALRRWLKTLSAEAGNESVAEDLPASLHRLSALVQGLRAWPAHRYRATVANLESYGEGEFEDDDAWMGAYRTPVIPILTDARLLASVPRTPDAADAVQMQSVSDALRQALEQLQLENGKPHLRERIAEVDRRLAGMAENRAKKIRNLDLAKLRQAAEQEAGFAAAWDFDGASEHWAKAEVETDWAAKLAKSRSEAWTKAGEFFDQFVGEIGNHKYQGEILRKEGSPFKARVVGATQKSLIVDLGFGATPLDMKSISPLGILRMARKTILKNAATEVLERAAFYAQFLGDKAYAQDLASELQGVAGFPRRWEAAIHSFGPDNEG